MQIALPELNAPATLILDLEDGLSDEEFVELCDANPDLRLERTAHGEIVILPPAGGDSDHRTADSIRQLGNWAIRDGRGNYFGSSVAFLLPDGSAFCPDSAWVSNERLRGLTKQQRRKYMRVVPEFVVEVLSPSDRLAAAQRKMSAWMANGVDLGWLIDGDNRVVHVYSKDRETRVLTGIDSLAGEGPVAGFVLDLRDIWIGI